MSTKNTALVGRQHGGKRAFIEMLRATVVDRKPVKKGEVVETSEATARTLVNIPNTAKITKKPEEPLTGFGEKRAKPKPRKTDE